MFQGGKTADEKFLSCYYLFMHQIKTAQRVGLDGNVYSAQGQASLTAMTDVIKEAFWFLIVYCFFTVGGVKFLQLSFL